jgi:hypothetical protein
VIVGPSDTSPPPEISVLVLAFERTGLLAGALRSVLTQGYPRDRLEVLVVANAIDGAVRRDFEPQGVRFILSSQPELGAKIAEGARAAMGEILCLLEDDDRYLPAKLAEVSQRFRADPDLAYYHNNFRTIGPDEAPFAGRFRKTAAARRIERVGRIYRRADHPIGGWEQFAGVFPGFNNSCIALRRQAFGPWWEFVARSDLTSDECLFLAAGACGGAILQDALILTEVMVHPESISNPIGESSGGDLGRLKAFSLRNARSRRVLIDLAARSGRTDLRRQAEAEVAIQDLVGCFRNPTANRRDFGRPLWTVVRDPRALAVRNFPSVAALGILGLVAPPFARSFYRWLKRVGSD